MLSPWLALSAAALANGASPRFVGDPADVALAAAAWGAAEACTGRAGRAADEVPIVRRTVIGDYLGVARTDPSGALYRIDLNAAPDRLREVVVHEVTHAWVSDGPVALVEGTAELIADCVAGRIGAPLQYDDGRALTGLPDLTTWDKPTEGAPSELHAVRTDGYVGAARLLRTAALAIDPAALWADRSIDWARFDAALADAGPRGAALVDAVHRGPAALAEALDDPDRDGLTTIAEGWLGTDPARFDTDGDGWWDGATPPADAVAVPLDGTPICADGRFDRASGLGGDFRGAEPPALTVRRLPTDAAVVGLAAIPSADTVGAVWVRRGSDAAGCAATRRVTVWAGEPRFAAVVPRMADALERAQAAA
ncbi:MAG: hypothetical protein ABMB14_20155, partial [Myxococcota bacterium]